MKKEEKKKKNQKTTTRYLTKQLYPNLAAGGINWHDPQTKTYTEMSLLRF